MNIERIDELLALQKAMMFVKFTTDDSEARYLAVSPILGSLLKKIRVELRPYFIDKGLNYPLDYGDIESHLECIDAVKRHMLNIPNWNDYDSNTQKEIIITLCEPFKVGDDTISQLAIERLSSF